MRRRTKARESALKILYAMDIRKDDYKTCLEDYWKSQGVVNNEIRSFSEYLVKGYSDHKEKIDSLISKYAVNWELDRMATIDRNILRMSIYELIHADDVPIKVTINEAVEMAKKYGDKDSGKFVNGILDKVSREEVKSAKKLETSGPDKNV